MRSRRFGGAGRGVAASRAAGLPIPIDPLRLCFKFNNPWPHAGSNSSGVTARRAWSLIACALALSLPMAESVQAQAGIKRAENAAAPNKALSKSPTLAQFDSRLASRPIALTEAISVALTLNPDLANAAANLAFAEGRIGEVRSGFMPTVSVGPGGEYVSHLVTPVYTIQATLPIDISRLVATATDQARFQEIGARLDINRIRNETVYRVESAFYSALRAQALLQVANENLTNSQERLRDAQAHYKARAVAYIDVVRAETDVADAQRQVIQAQSSVTGALGVLSGAMGINPSEPPAISDSGAVLLSIKQSVTLGMPQRDLLRLECRRRCGLDVHKWLRRSWRPVLMISNAYWSRFDVRKGKPYRTAPVLARLRLVATFCTYLQPTP